MAENSKIQWTTHTMNPWRGCSKVAAGCANCYADRQSKRNPKTLGIWGPDGTRVVASEAMWEQPAKWHLKAGVALTSHDIYPEHHPVRPSRPRVFCASLADVFEDWPGEVVDHLGCSHYTKDGDPTVVVTGEQMRGCVSDGYHYTTLDDCRGRLFRLIDQTPNLSWLLLTKRPENIRRMWVDPELDGNLDARASAPYGSPSRVRRDNVWLGTSVACQADAEKNIPALLACRDLAKVLFLSIEPLIEPVNLTRFDNGRMRQHWNVLDGSYFQEMWDGGGGIVSRSEHRIDWVICGGESGPKARPCHIDWIRSVVRQCREADVPCFVKQLGSSSWRTVYGGPAVVDGGIGVHRLSHEFQNKLSDPKGGDPEEWFEDLRVRELPGAKA